MMMSPERNMRCIAVNVMRPASPPRSCLLPRLENPGVHVSCFIEKFISKCRVSIPECEAWILTVNTGLLSKSVPPYSRMRGVCLL